MLTIYVENYVNKSMKVFGPRWQTLINLILTTYFCVCVKFTWWSLANSIATLLLTKIHNFTQKSWAVTYRNILLNQVRWFITGPNSLSSGYRTNRGTNLIKCIFICVFVFGTFISLNCKFSSKTPE